MHHPVPPGKRAGQDNDDVISSLKCIIQSPPGRGRCTLHIIFLGWGEGWWRCATETLYQTLFRHQTLDTKKNPTLKGRVFFGVQSLVSEQGLV